MCAHYEFTVWTGPSYDYESPVATCEYCHTSWQASEAYPAYVADGREFCRRCFLSFQDSSEDNVVLKERG